MLTKWFVSTEDRATSAPSTLRVSSYRSLTELVEDLALTGRLPRSTAVSICLSGVSCALEVGE